MHFTFVPSGSLSLPSNGGLQSSTAVHAADDNGRSRQPSHWFARWNHALRSPKPYFSRPAAPRAQDHEVCKRSRPANAHVTLHVVISASPPQSTHSRDRLATLSFGGHARCPTLKGDDIDDFGIKGDRVFVHCKAQLTLVTDRLLIQTYTKR